MKYMFLSLSSGYCFHNQQTSFHVQCFPPSDLLISSQGYVKSDPEDDIKHQAWGRKLHAWEESFTFLYVCFLFSHVLIIAGPLRNINTRLFQNQKTKWLISGLWLCVLIACTLSTHTDAGMHVGLLRHVCSCMLKGACQVREICEMRSQVLTCLMRHFCFTEMSLIWWITFSVTALFG